MKVPISWLKEYVEFDATAAQVAEKLTFSGVEVEGVHAVGGDFEGIVAGEILSIDRHPSADRLSLCRVNDGRKECRVVCGASNFKVGDKAPFAGIGATLPSGLVIRQAKIRGELSEGMLCAEDELGLSKDHSGLMLLPGEIAAGTPLSAVLGPPDTVLELEITWNRPDCLSIIGMAREMGALFGTRLRLPAVDVADGGAAVESLVRVLIEDPESCPRYTARFMDGVKIGPSPFWMQRRLALCGVRPINNVVDITNYVMLECGQPLHAFDYELLEGHEIVVRRARPGEKMATLDNIERPISPEMLLIADAKRPVAVAGVMGGAGSEIRDITSRVLLESACFAPPGIRKTSSKLGLSTESSHRFERGVDVGNVEWASRRAAQLMAAHAGATVAKGVVDVYPGRPAERRVTCRYERARRLLGMDIGATEVVKILEALELPVVEKTADACTVSVPTFRHDLEIEADLIEEVARMHGLEQVPTSEPVSKVVANADDRRPRALIACRANLIGLGLSEVMHYSFMSQGLLDKFGRETAARRVVLPNPVSADYAVLRDSLIPQMAESLGRNLSRQNETARFFEFGKAYLKAADGRLTEDDRLCIGLMGKAGRMGIDRRRPVAAEEMFLWMKGLVESFCEGQRIDDVRGVSAGHPAMEAGWAVLLEIDGKAVGCFGLLAESIRREWRMLEPVAIAEISLVPLLGHTFDLPRSASIPAYPSVTRDVAMIVPDKVTHEQILAVIRKSASSELTDVELFDIFKTKTMGDTHKSVAYSLVYRSPERTLTDVEANGFHESIKKALRSELGAEIRES